MCPYGPSKAAHEALVALMARELEGTGVTANVLIPGGTTITNLVPRDVPPGWTPPMEPEVMRAPAVWLASDESAATNGMRFIAYHWDESLPIEQRLEKGRRACRLAPARQPGHRPPAVMRVVGDLHIWVPVQFLDTDMNACAILNPERELSALFPCQIIRLPKGQ